MNLANVLLYVALLAYVVYRRVQGKAIGTTKQLFVLPLVLTVLGYEDLAHKPLRPVDVVFTVLGCALSLGLGALRGLYNRLSEREGAPWVQWGSASVAIFAVNVVAKLALDGVSVVAGGTVSGATSSLVLAAGLMLLGEAAVVWFRLEGSTSLLVERHGQE